ncbi:MAG: hypothetical protein OXI91_01520 [Chloroflexota bacterium]|nr:hypothetical protein [Chloroflexota bacterium]
MRQPRFVPEIEGFGALSASPGDPILVRRDGSGPPLDLPGGYRYCFLEYERRATTPRPVRARLENYWRYFQSGYARRDHGGDLPLVLFVFETPDDEDAFMDAASYVDHAPFASSNLETIAQHGVLADTWLPPAPEPWERLQLQRLVKVPLFR